jgi:hypothetical protein
VALLLSSAVASITFVFPSSAKAFAPCKCRESARRRQVIRPLAFISVDVVVVRSPRLMLFE